MKISMPLDAIGAGDRTSQLAAPFAAIARFFSSLADHADLLDVPAELAELDPLLLKDLGISDEPVHRQPDLFASVG